MNDDSPRDARLTETAQAIHADNLHLLARLDADDCNPGIELDCTLNGAQEHIFDFFEALAAYRHGEVPWRGVSFMIDSTNALVRILESRYGMASAHAVGQAFRASKVWWCVDESAPRLSRKAYLKHLVAAREAIYDALNTLNCELFVRTAAPPASPPPAATKSDLRAAVKTILRGEDVNAAKPGPRLTPAKRRQIEAAEAWRKSHAGCTLHNACMRSFVPTEGGYKSADALYAHMHEGEKLGIPPTNS